MCAGWGWAGNATKPASVEQRDTAALGSAQGRSWRLGERGKGKANDKLFKVSPWSCIVTVRWRSWCGACPRVPSLCFSLRCGRELAKAAELAWQPAGRGGCLGVPAGSVQTDLLPRGLCRLPAPQDRRVQAAAASGCEASAARAW